MKKASTSTKDSFTKRLKSATGYANKSELSSFFDVAHSTIANWIAKGKLPIGQENLLRLRGINPEWVQSGKGRKLLELSPRIISDAQLEIVCPLRVDLQRILKICGNCSAWSSILQNQGEKH